MEDEILKSWGENSSEWIKAIETRAIGSRKFSNKAILDAITKTNANKIVDMGCGEGWLTRELSKMGKHCIGLDANRELLKNARSKGPEGYYELAFDAIAKGTSIPEAPHQLAVLNFCLYGEDIGNLLCQILKNLDKNGKCLIQTLHPYFLVQMGKSYSSQRLEDSWAGLPGDFKNGHSWYARTFGGWSQLLNTLKDTTFSFVEVVDDQQKPISLIISIDKID